MYPFIAKVHYYEESDNGIILNLKRTHLLLYATTFADAAAQVERHFGTDIEDMKLWAISDEGTFFEVSGAVANALRAGLGNYKDGIKHIQEALDEEEAE